MATTPQSGEQAVAFDVKSTSTPPSRIGRLWQFPLLLLSLGMFGFASYRLIDPKPAPTIEQRLAGVDNLLKTNRADLALEDLRVLLAEDESKSQPAERATMHLYLARAIDQVQQSRHIDIAANHQHIIEQLKLAEKSGEKLDASSLRRMAESYLALGKSTDALVAFRASLAADSDKPPALQRKIIDLLIARGDSDGVESELKKYLLDKRISPVDRSWALGEQSRIMADRGLFSDAKEIIAQAVKGVTDPALLGQLNYRLGYCHWKLGEDAEAERYLRLARDQLKSGSPQDADAALLLGRILQGKGKHAEAISFFQSVINDHPESTAAPVARLRRGVSRIESEQDAAGLADLHDVAGEIAAKPSRDQYRAEALTAIRQCCKRLTAGDNLEGALELMALEQLLESAPSAEFFGRLSVLYERRAAQLGAPAAPDPPAAGSATAAAAAAVRKTQQVQELLAKAGDAAIAQSRGLTLQDDRGYGEALWRGIDLYDRVGALPQVIAALELFIAERPEDPLTPEALLRLGKAFHASGQFDKAIEAFRKNQFRYPQSLAAQKSGVPLAKALIAKGQPFYEKAETALRATLDSHIITPDAEEFRDALFELAQLYYRTSRYEDAVGRLEELTARYPPDDGTGQLLFLMADSYRKSAALLQVAPKPPADAANIAQQLAAQAEVTGQYRQRLAQSRRLYDRTIEQYRTTIPKTDLDRLYLKLAHFYRADCVYDEGNYDEAIHLYDAAAMRYQDDPSALAAYVQIVNAYAALNRPEEAKAANERARWLLKRMPPEAFKELHRTMPQKSWDDWMNWSKTAGLF